MHWFSAPPVQPLQIALQTMHILLTFYLGATQEVTHEFPSKRYDAKQPEQVLPEQVEQPKGQQVYYCN